MEYTITCDGIWCGDGNTEDGTTADVPDEVLAMADAGETGTVEVGDSTYLVSAR